MEELKKEEGGEGGEVSYDDQAEKLHFHGDKLNQVFDEGLGQSSRLRRSCQHTRITATCVM